MKRPYIFIGFTKLLLVYFTLMGAHLALAQNQTFSLDEVIERRDTSFINVHTAIGQIGRDTTLVKEFIEKCRAADYPEGMTVGLDRLAINYRNASQYDKAISVHKEALTYSERCKSVIFKVTSLNMLGVVYRRIDRVKEGMDAHQEALELIDKSGLNDHNALKSTAVSHNSIGNIYLTMREGDLALKEFALSMEIERKIDNKLGLAINYQNIGGIYEEKGQLDKALESFEMSLAYNDSISSDYGRVICKNSIGNIYILQGKYQQALDLVLPTISVAEKNGDMYYIVETYTNTGRGYLGINNLPKAQLYLEKALDVAKKHSLQYYIAENYKHLSKLSEQQGDFKKAFEYSELFYENEKKFLNKENQDYVANLIMKYDSEKKKDTIDLLEKENELVNLKLSDNRKLFTALVLVLVLLSGLLYFFYRQHKLKSEKELLSMEQTMLRSQMNPHFIFNSLNSIKLYIINNDKDKAVYYLNKFSKLIRAILTTSQERDITLHDELGTMELYMNIENIRFSNKINFETSIDPHINTNQIKIPSMILQPFLENAIWHGLSSKEGDKRVSLKVQKATENVVEIQIEDNGIGRKRSREINSNKTLNRKSIGIQLTQDRLENYFKKTEGEYSILIYDLEDDKGVATGTLVSIKLPAKYMNLHHELEMEA